MPAKYDPTKALPLRVPAELRARLDAVASMVPAPLRLPRNTVAVVALARGLEAIAAELSRDVMAVHRAVAGDVVAAPAAAPPSTEHAPREPVARTGSTPKPSRSARRGNTSKRDRARPATAPTAGPHDETAMRARWNGAGLTARAFCEKHNITRSAFLAWVGGRSARPSTVARIAAALDAAGL